MDSLNGSFHYIILNYPTLNSKYTIILLILSGIHTMENLPKNKKIILFDGICNLCNSSVLTIIKYDKKDQFRFVSLQSEMGKQIISYLGIDASKMDSVLLYEPRVSYEIKSDAALQIMNAFGGLWKLSWIFSYLPVSLRNMIYDFIARNRYKWFGKKEQCMIPTPELKSKFLE